MTWHDILTWSPLGVSAAALGIWWALRRKNRAPTVRMILALIVGWGITVLAGVQIVRLGGWLQSEIAGLLPGRWSELFPVLLAAFVFFSAVILLACLHPKEKPDRMAEWLAISFAAAFLLIGGTLPHAIPLGSLS